MTYKFHKDVLGPIMSHISAYDLLVTSLTVSNDVYTMTTNGEISQEEFLHLEENYQLEMV